MLMNKQSPSEEVSQPKQSLASADITSGASVDTESERKDPAPKPIGAFAKVPPAQTEKTANLIANAIMHQ